MALYKRTNSKYWWLDFEFEGRRHQLSTKCTNRREAQQFEAAYRTNLARGQVGLESKRDAPTFETAAAEFLISIAEQIEPSTLRRYQTAGMAPTRYFRQRRLDTLERKDIDGFVNWRKVQRKAAPVKKKKRSAGSNTIKPATINRELAFVRMVFNYVEPGLWQKITQPAKSRKFKFARENNEQLRTLEAWEDSIYLIACSQPLRDVAELMLETGMRPSEVCSLQRSHLNFEIGYIQVIKGKTRSARRKIPMSDRARAILQLRSRTASNDYLFAGGKNGDGDKPIIKLNNAHNGAIDRCKLKTFRLYDLRHTFATRAVEAGVDLITLKDILGHSRLDQVLRYAHPTEKHRFDAMKKVEAYRAAM